VAVAEARAVLRAVRVRVLADYRAVAEGVQTHADEVDDGSPDAADTTPDSSTDSPEDLAPTSRTPEGANVPEINEGVARLTVDREYAALSSSVTATTTTEIPTSPTPEEAPAAALLTDAEQVAAALWRQCIATDDSLMAAIIDGCREGEPTATGVEISYFIDLKGPLARTKKSPGGFLRTAVTNCFAGASFAQYRVMGKAASEAQTAQEQPPTEEELAHEAESKEWEARQERLKQHPEECGQCGGRGHYQFETRRKICNCPAGDRRRCLGERDVP
jgi:hypothetical protein